MPWHIVIIWLLSHASTVEPHGFATLEACERQAAAIRPKDPFTGSSIAAVYCAEGPVRR